MGAIVVFTLLSCGLGASLADPKLLSVLRTELLIEDNGTGGAAFDVVSNGTHLFVSANGGIVVAEVADGLHAKVVGHLLLTDGADIAPLALRGTTLVVGGGLTSFVDVTHPEAPTLTATFTNTAVVHDLVLQGNTLFVLAETLIVYDVTDPAHLVELSRFALPDGVTVGTRLGHTNSVFFFGVGDRANTPAQGPPAGLVFVDGSNPRALVEVGHLDGGNAGSFAVLGTTLFATGNVATQLIDIHDPHAPTATSNTTIANTALATYGRFLLTGFDAGRAIGGDSAQFFDVGDLTQPYSNVTDAGFTRAFVDEHFAYFASSAGVAIVGPQP
jgi:hypothetical protein